MPYTGNKPADNQTIAQGPADIRDELQGLATGQVVNAGTLKGLSPGNASGNIPVSNGNICTNLNAEKLGGNTASAFAGVNHTHAVATSSSPGMMSNTDKAKLDTVATNAEVNQNAFSNVLVGSTTIQADGKTDTLELVAGANVALTPDATNDRVTVAVTGKVPSAAAADSAAACTGNAATATTAGACTGNAATATKLATARTLALTGGVTGSGSFDGSGNLSIAATVAGNAPTATKLATSRTINGVAFDGSANITVTAVANGGNAATVGGYTPGTGVNNVLKLDSGGKVPVANLPVSSIQQPLIILNDTKSNGANGGTFTAGAWQQRTLNTLVIDQTSGVVLSNNQFTLPAGTYEIQASAPAAVVNYHQARLRNVTDGTTAAIGTSEYSPNGPANRSFILGAFTIASSKVFQIEHYCTASSSDIGFGRAASIGVGEVYTTVLLRKLA